MLQLAVLACFPDSNGGAISMESLKQATGMSSALLRSIVDPLLRIKLLLKTVDHHDTGVPSPMLSINERFKARHTHVFLAALSSSNAVAVGANTTLGNKDGESEEEDVIMGELAAFVEDEWEGEESEAEEAYTLDMRLTILQVASPHTFFIVCDREALEAKAQCGCCGIGLACRSHRVGVGQVCGERGRVRACLANDRSKGVCHSRGYRRRGSLL